MSAVVKATVFLRPESMLLRTGLLGSSCGVCDFVPSDVTAALAAFFGLELSLAGVAGGDLGEVGDMGDDFVVGLVGFEDAFGTCLAEFAAAAPARPLTSSTSSAADFFFALSSSDERLLDMIVSSVPIAALLLRPPPRRRLYRPPGPPAPPPCAPFSSSEDTACRVSGPGPAPLLREAEEDAAFGPPPAEEADWRNAVPEPWGATCTSYWLLRE